MSFAASSGPLGLAIALAMVMLAAGILLALGRLLRGPSTPDRVVALDQIALLTAGMIAVHAIASGEPELLTAAMALALLSFLGTVSFAWYLERVERR